jgi:uncharacterized membrane protein
MDLVSVFCRKITTVPSTSYILGIFVKNKMGITVWIHIQVLYSVPLVFISAFVPEPSCCYCYGSVIELEVR